MTRVYSAANNKREIIQRHDVVKLSFLFDVQ